MAVDRTTPLFYDATGLYAAAYSPTGGSARVVRLCQLGWFSGWASQLVLVETERAVRRKGTAATLAGYEQLLKLTPLAYAPVLPSPASRYPEVNPKDAHVYAAARACGAHFLLTLDRRLADQINALAADPIALSPGEFLNDVLPTHPDYPANPAAAQRPKSDAAGA